MLHAFPHLVSTLRVSFVPGLLKSFGDGECIIAVYKFIVRSTLKVLLEVVYGGNLIEREGVSGRRGHGVDDDFGIGAFVDSD